MIFFQNLSSESHRGYHSKTQPKLSNYSHMRIGKGRNTPAERATWNFTKLDTRERYLDSHPTDWNLSGSQLTSRIPFAWPLATKMKYCTCSARQMWTCRATGINPDQFSFLFSFLVSRPRWNRETNVGRWSDRGTSIEYGNLSVAYQFLLSWRLLHSRVIEMSRTRTSLDFIPPPWRRVSNILYLLS